MAIKIYEQFAPFANPADGDYPYGSIKNDSIPGAEDGTPLDATWGNDYAGFDAALLSEAGIVPNGNPDTVVESQRVEAINTLIARKTNVYASQIATAGVMVDQGANLRTGYAMATAAGKEFIIDDVFWIDVTSQSIMIPNETPYGILLLANSVIRFQGAGDIKVIPNSSAAYNVFLACLDVDNYTIIRPRITGDRLNHTYGGSTHEWGYGIAIYESSNGTIIDPDIEQTTGDGIYVGKAWGSTLESVPTNIKILRPKIRYTRRNGISLTSYDGLSIFEPDISHIGDSDGIEGAWPKACMDIEPESDIGAKPPRCLRGFISSPRLSNAFAGFYCYGFKSNLSGYNVPIEMRVTGVMTLDGIENTGLGVFTHPSIDGYLTIDTVDEVTKTYISITNGACKSDTFITTINTFYVKGGAVGTSFMNFSARAGDDGNPVGNMRINNINNQISAHLTVSLTPIDNYPTTPLTVHDLSMSMASDTQRGLTTFEGLNPAQVNKTGVYIPSVGFVYVYSGFSAATLYMPNIVWQDPSVGAPSTSVYINTYGDYRDMQIGLYPLTSAVGQGCNIQGIKIRKNGVVYTQARCVEEGGYIRFRNSPTGETLLIGISGEWTFSEPL